MLNIQSQFDLSGLNTMALPSICHSFVQVSTLDEAKSAIRFACENQLPVVILGGGSNVLLSENIDALVLQYVDSAVGWPNGSQTFISVGAGCNWDDFVQQSLDRGYFGLENLSLIPGSVGAAPIQNIGAYGVEVSQYIAGVDILDVKTLATQTLTGPQCGFAYRDSVFKAPEGSDWMICRVSFNLPRQFSAQLSYSALADAADALGDNLSAVQIRDLVSSIRREKLPDPVTVANAGSFFKNPIVSIEQYHRLKKQSPELVAWPYQGQMKLAAGWLIDRSGWRGKSLGPVLMSPQQALVMINKSGADLNQVLALATQVRLDVAKMFDVMLEIEPRLI